MYLLYSHSVGFTAHTWKCNCKCCFLTYENNKSYTMVNKAKYCVCIICRSSCIIKSRETDDYTRITQFNTEKMWFVSWSTLQEGNCSQTEWVISVHSFTMTCLLVCGKEQMFFEYVINITLLQIFTRVSPTKQIKWKLLFIVQAEILVIKYWILNKKSCRHLRNTQMKNETKCNTAAKWTLQNHHMWVFFLIKTQQTQQALLCKHTKACW